MSVLLAADAAGDLHTSEREWFGKIVHFYSGSIDEIARQLPDFGRRPFAFPDPRATAPEATTPPIKTRGENQFWDLIVRFPKTESEPETPVGMVSKRYKLVQHRDLFDKAKKALGAVGINVGDIRVNLGLSPYGSRMLLVFELPDCYAYDPGDGETVKLRFICINSVDGSCRLTIMLGWFRLVCENGLLVGTAQLRQRLIHKETLEISNLDGILAEGITRAKEEQNVYRKWVQTQVSREHLTSWVDGPLRKEWGVLAAARTYLICQTGCDGRFAKPFQCGSPHEKEMEITRAVPGAPKEAKDAYSVSQALAWIARGSRDLQDEVDAMRRIPALMNSLIRRSERSS